MRSLVCLVFFSLSLNHEVVFAQSEHDTRQGNVTRPQLSDEVILDSLTNSISKLHYVATEAWLLVDHALQQSFNTLGIQLKVPDYWRTLHKAIESGDTAKYSELNTYLDRAEQLDPTLSKLLKLASKVQDDDKQEKLWEQALWTVPHSELLSGEYIAIHAGIELAILHTEGRPSGIWQSENSVQWDCQIAGMPLEFEGSLRRRLIPSNEKIASCILSAPPGVVSRIFMERLRRGIDNYSALSDLKGKSDPDETLYEWRSAWLDARNVYCRRSPDSKYRDLSNGEQSCKVSTLQ